MIETLIPLVVVAVLAGGALLFARAQRLEQEKASRQGPRKAGVTALRQHLDQLANRMTFDRLAIGTDGRSAVGYLPAQRRLVFVGTAWVDGPAAKRGELRTFDVGAEDLVGAEVVQTHWTRPYGKADAKPYARSVLLKVFTSDLDAPTHAIELLDDDASLGGESHLDALHAAIRWEGLVRALVAGSSRDAATTDALAGLSEEEARRERARQLASKVLAARGTPLPEGTGRQVR